MLSIITFLIKIILNLGKSKESLLITIALLEKEIEILKRRNKKRCVSKFSDRIIFTVLNISYNIKDSISIFKPETILKWQKTLIKSFWTFKHGKRRKGRPPVPIDIKQLILKIKNDNLYWRVTKIQGELTKLSIILDPKTVWNILNNFRRKGKIRKSLTWEKFLEMHAKSLYAMDFFTVDTFLNKRFYVLFIHHATREIVHFAMTENPTREFARQQIIQFKESVNYLCYLIHDNGSQFKLNFLNYGINAIPSSVKAPNMNSIAERFIGSVRREALDYYLIFSEKQLRNILTVYIDYYNSQRPHQGIGQNIPKGYSPSKEGKILSKPVLGGLHHHYFRKAA